ncbi:MAG: dihydrodipicolinate synthase family protein [Chloroflexota bacterium]
MTQVKQLWITGLVPAVFSPMHADGSLHLEMVPRLVEHLVQNGAAGLYVCGSTGEGPSLTSAERQAVVEAYVQAAAGRLPVIVQVGHDSLAEARQLAAHAQAIGADAISAVPPVYFRIDSLETLLDCLADITAGAPGLPFYYYHIPRLTAARIDVVRFLQLGAQHLPNLTGVKYSDFTVFELQACASLESGRFNMLFGSDEMLLAGLVGGAQGAVGTTYNFAAPLYNQIIAAYRRGELNEAQRLQGLSVRMLEAINRYATAATNLPAMKAMMKIIGLDCGPLRLPLTNPTAQQLETLRAEMQSIGFFEWGQRRQAP